MPAALVCISPAESHVGPMLTLVRALAGHGWRVRVLTGDRFAGRIRAAFASEDHAEGLRAQREKRPPVFTGR